MTTEAAVQGAIVTTWMRDVAEAMRAESAHLTQLDAAIGDGDHGVNMERGFSAVEKALAGQNPDVPPGRLLIVAGKTLVSTVGGASGPLAPPTEETSVLPAIVSSLPGGSPPFCTASAFVTASKPRFMLMPWSPSPIAASSCVR